MVLGMLFDNFKNYFIVRYNIYDFLKIVSEGPQPTCLVRTFCAICDKLAKEQGLGTVTLPYMS